MTDVVTLSVWVNDDAKVASFHKEEGYERKDYFCRDSFLDFLQSLIKLGYRFM